MRPGQFPRRPLHRGQAASIRIPQDDNGESSSTFIKTAPVSSIVAFESCEREGARLS